MPVVGGADQRGPKSRGVGKIEDRGALGRAQPLDLFIDIFVGALFEVLPCRHRIGRDDLHRLVELFPESGHQVRMPADHRVHRIAQAVGIKGTGHGEIQPVSDDYETPFAFSATLHRVVFETAEPAARPDATTRFIAASRAD